MTKNAVDAGTTYVALDTAWCKSAGSPGGMLLVRRGDRLLGSHAVVTAYSRLFAEDGLDAADVQALEDTYRTSGGNSP